jgi:CRISPR system Cascade subunit CasB
MREEAKLVGNYVSYQIQRLTGPEQGSASRAAFARLRRGIGKAPGSMPELWDATLNGLPVELLSRDGRPSYGEWAVHTTLTLFALHQQGSDPKTSCMNRDGVYLGKAIRGLVRTEEDMTRVKRRFDAAATSDSLTEFSHHLRGLIQLLKAAEIPLDYPALAKDIYWYQFEGVRDRIRLRWGQDFYHHPIQDRDKDTAANQETGGE